MEETTPSEKMNCDESSVSRDLSEDEIQAQLMKIKGDAIGNTLYSERWVLKTLIRLSNYPEELWNEDFEQDMCLLWDMTTEADVNNFLSDNDGFSVLFRILVQAPNCKDHRLIEIVIGIIGNACSVEKVRHELTKSDLFCEIVTNLIILDDALSLIQLVRLFNTCLWELRKPDLLNTTSRCGSPIHKTDSFGVESLDETIKKMAVNENYEKKWLNCLHENKDRFFLFLFFCLSSSTNENLLCSTLELLETLLQLPVLDAASITSTSETNVQSVIEALQELLKPIKVGDSVSSNKKLWRWYKVWGNIIAVIATFETGRNYLYSKAKYLLKCLMKLLLVFTTPEALQTQDPIMVLDCLSILESFPPIEVLPVTIAKFITVLQRIHEQAQTMPTDNTEEFEDEDTVTLSHLKLRLDRYCLHLLHGQDVQLILEHLPDYSYLLMLAQHDSNFNRVLEQALLALRTNGLVGSGGVDLND